MAKKAYSPREILAMKKKVFPFTGAWYDLFRQPETTGVWFIWGNSGNGKSSFTMQLAKALSEFEPVAYNSLEDGTSLTMQEQIKKYAMEEQQRQFKVLDCESIEDLTERLSKPKQPRIIILDSFQYTQLTYKSYLKFKEAHRDRLLIFISHADGKSPAGRSAKSVMYDAMLKIWVEGHRAFSKGRFIGPVGHYDVWPERAEFYWGDKKQIEK